MNPMVRKELRQRMRERRAWLVPTLYLIALGAVAAISYKFNSGDPFDLGPWKEPQGAEIGMALFSTVAYTQLTLLLLLVPVLSAGTFTIEKEQRTLPALLTSLLTTWEIWWGKFIAALLFLVLLLVTSLPVLSLTFALGGVGFLDLAITTAISLLVLASMSSVGLYCSSYFRRSVYATSVTYAFLVALSIVTVVAFLLLERWWASQQVLRGGSQEPPWWVAAPLFLNPYFPLSVGRFAKKEVILGLGVSLALFLGIGLLAAVLALRNLRRGYEDV